MNTEYKAGQICVVIDTPELGTFSFAAGREVTILEGLADRGSYADEYLVELQGYGIVTAQHHILRPRKEPPKDSSSDEEAFRRFMAHTLMPLAAEQMEEA